MISIIFKNIKPSEIMKNRTLDRMQTIINRFPDLQGHVFKVTLSMENSPMQAGPDIFIVKVFIDGVKYKKIVLEKAQESFYKALADVVEHALERLNRYGDKNRVKQINKARELLDFMEKAIS